MNSSTTSGMRGVVFSEADVAEALRSYGGEASAAVAKNPKLVQNTCEVLKAAVERKYVELGVAGLGGLDTITASSNAPRDTKNAVKVASFAASSLQLSAALRGVRAMSEGGALIVIGATFVTKTGLTMGLAGDDQQRLKCAGAIMEVAGNVTITAMTAETGIGLVLGAFAIAASALNAYNECR